MRYKVSLEQIESDLTSSRKKVLELLDDKTTTENLIFNLKDEGEKMQEVIKLRESKIQELQESLNDTCKQFNNLQNQIVQNDTSQFT